MDSVPIRALQERWRRGTPRMRVRAAPNGAGRWRRPLLLLRSLISGQLAQLRHEWDSVPIATRGRPLCYGWAMISGMLALCPPTLWRALFPPLSRRQRKVTLIRGLEGRRRSRQSAAMRASQWRREIVIRRRATRQRNEDGKGFGAGHDIRRMSRQNGKTTRTATDGASATEGGGERGIRTLGRVSPTHAFQACSFNHSDISPCSKKGLRAAGNQIIANSPRLPNILSIAFRLRILSGFFATVSGVLAPSGLSDAPHAHSSGRPRRQGTPLSHPSGRAVFHEVKSPQHDQTAHRRRGRSR